jgi:hypothetical protein
MAFVTRVKIPDIIWKENIDSSIVGPSVIGIVALRHPPHPSLGYGRP